MKFHMDATRKLAFDYAFQLAMGPTAQWNDRKLSSILTVAFEIEQYLKGLTNDIHNQKCEGAPINIGGPWTDAHTGVTHILKVNAPE